MKRFNKPTVFFCAALVSLAACSKPSRVVRFEQAGPTQQPTQSKEVVMPEAEYMAHLPETSAALQIKIGDVEQSPVLARIESTEKNSESGILKFAAQTVASFPASGMQKVELVVRMPLKEILGKSAVDAKALASVKEAAPLRISLVNSASQAKTQTAVTEGETKSTMIIEAFGLSQVEEKTETTSDPGNRKNLMIHKGALPLDASAEIYQLPTEVEFKVAVDQLETYSSEIKWTEDTEFSLIARTEIAGKDVQIEIPFRTPPSKLRTQVISTKEWLEREKKSDRPMFGAAAPFLTLLGDVKAKEKNALRMVSLIEVGNLSDRTVELMIPTTMKSGKLERHSIERFVSNSVQNVNEFDCSYKVEEKKNADVLSAVFFIPLSTDLKGADPARFVREDSRANEMEIGAQSVGYIGVYALDFVLSGVAKRRGFHAEAIASACYASCSTTTRINSDNWIDRARQFEGEFADPTKLSHQQYFCWQKSELERAFRPHELRKWFGDKEDLRAEFWIEEYQKSCQQVADACASCAGGANADCNRCARAELSMKKTWDAKMKLAFSAPFRDVRPNIERSQHRYRCELEFKGGSIGHAWDIKPIVETKIEALGIQDLALSWKIQNDEVSMIEARFVDSSLGRASKFERTWNLFNLLGHPSQTEFRETLVEHKR